MESVALAILSEDYSAPQGHRTLAEKAFETLHRAIITGRLRPGTRLPIEDLAEALRMSPMPIREAVRRLDAYGLVENIPHRGARVSELSIADLAQVYEVRLALEVPAIRRAAERFDTGHALIAQEILDALHAETDYSSAEASAAHEGFHFALYEAAGSAWLLRLIRPPWQTSERYRLEFQPCKQLSAHNDEHKEILDACVARDPDWAARLLSNHLTETANAIALGMGSEPLPDLQAPGRG
jgi:DNA-binding GntR family transcriptional regulator